jgi:hypothetical protein
MSQHEQIGQHDQNEQNYQNELKKAKMSHHKST